jgi:hypothetical protein
VFTAADPAQFSKRPATALRSGTCSAAARVPNSEIPIVTAAELPDRA